MHIIIYGDLSNYKTCLMCFCKWRLGGPIKSQTNELLPRSCYTPLIKFNSTVHANPRCTQLRRTDCVILYYVLILRMNIICYVMSGKGPSKKYATLEEGGGPSRCDSLRQRRLQGHVTSH